MSKRDFEKWFATFRESINGYDYYADFEKICRNARKLRDEINILNLLVKAEDIESEFLRIIKKYPECLKAIPILLAVRSYEIYCQDENSSLTYRFDKVTQTPEQYAYFMHRTGLFDLIQNNIIHDLNDYVTGVETGLDSNGRKNRGGHQMENLVARYLTEANIPYSREITTSEISSQFGIILPESISQNKRWDFAVKTPSILYAIETNFYTVGGSKPNETARSYKQIAEHARNVPGFVFVWITDGNGWASAKNNLHETFCELETIYNISDMEQGIFTRIFHR